MARRAVGTEPPVPMNATDRSISAEARAARERTVGARYRVVLRGEVFLSPMGLLLLPFPCK